MRRIILPAMILIGIYLDSILFSRLNIGGIRPDALMSVVVSAGVLPPHALAASMAMRSVHVIHCFFITITFLLSKLERKIRVYT